MENYILSQHFVWQSAMRKRVVLQIPAFSVSVRSTGLLQDEDARRRPVHDLNISKVANSGKVVPSEFTFLMLEPAEKPSTLCKVHRLVAVLPPEGINPVIISRLHLVLNTFIGSCKHRSHPSEQILFIVPSFYGQNYFWVWL